MAVVTAEGIAAPFDEDGQPYHSLSSREAALHGFRLTFLAPADREIALLQVLAGGESQDLTPTAELQPAAVPDGRLSVAFQDADPSGEEFGYDVSHSILQGVPARRFQVRDVGCVGKCVRRITIPSDGPLPPPSPPLLALVGFRLFFIGGREQEVDRVGVWFRGNDLHVAFRDANGGETFGYLVDFIALPRPVLGMNVSTGILRGSARGFETVSLPNPSHADFLLTGWAFNFKRDDQKLLDIGVLHRPNLLTVIYGDNGGGDEFDWRVEWAHVGPQVVHQ